MRLFGGLAAFAFALMFCCAPAFAAAAGTVVSNIATLHFVIDGHDRTTLSNKVSLIVGERLDVSVTADAPGALIAGTDARAVPFLVTNLGNGEEDFALTATVEGSGGAARKIVADTDDDGLYDPAIDRDLADARLLLASGKSARIFVIVSGAQDSFGATLTATATTGSGTPGALYAGRGDGGGDAVVGPTGATATAQTGLALRTIRPSLIKSQAVAATDGITRAIKGAIVTYRLDARFPRATAAVEIADPIPAGTAYVAGSLTLDGVRLSDAPGDDAGRFGDDAVGVELGDVAPGTRTIIFQVRIL